LLLLLSLCRQRLVLRLGFLGLRGSFIERLLVVLLDLGLSLRFGGGDLGLLAVFLLLLLRDPRLVLRLELLLLRFRLRRPAHRLFLPGLRFALGLQRRLLLSAGTLERLLLVARHRTRAALRLHRPRGRRRRRGGGLRWISNRRLSGGRRCGRRGCRCRHNPGRVRRRRQRGHRGRGGGRRGLRGVAGGLLRRRRLALRVLRVLGLQRVRRRRARARIVEARALRRERRCERIHRLVLGHRRQELLRRARQRRGHAHRVALENLRRDHHH